MYANPEPKADSIGCSSSTKADIDRRSIRQITPSLLTPSKKLDMFDLFELPCPKAPGLEPRMLRGFDFGVSPLCFFGRGDPRFWLICSLGGGPPETIRAQQNDLQIVSLVVAEAGAHRSLPLPLLRLIYSKVHSLFPYSTSCSESFFQLNYSGFRERCFHSSSDLGTCLERPPLPRPPHQPRGPATFRGPQPSLLPKKFRVSSWSSASWPTAPPRQRPPSRPRRKSFTGSSCKELLGLQTLEGVIMEKISLKDLVGFRSPLKG